MAQDTKNITDIVTPYNFTAGPNNEGIHCTIKGRKMEVVSKGFSGEDFTILVTIDDKFHFYTHKNNLTMEIEEYFPTFKIIEEIDEFTHNTLFICQLKDITSVKLGIR